MDPNNPIQQPQEPMPQPVQQPVQPPMSVPQPMPAAAPHGPLPFGWISLGLGAFGLLVMILLLSVGGSQWLLLIPLLIGAGGAATAVLALKQQFQNTSAIVGLIIGILLAYEGLIGIVAVVSY